MDTVTNGIIVRIHPAKFWSATRLMSNEERETLLEAIGKLARAGDVSGLEHFDFVSVSSHPELLAS